METIPIDEIQIGPRWREDLGDLPALARSIQRYGLLHPLVITRSKRLIAGWRRVMACKLLGWTHIEVRYYEDLPEEDRRAIELEEDLRRKDLTPYERSKARDELAKAVAARLLQASQASEELSGNADENSPRGRPPKVDADEKVAAEMGISQGTLSDAKRHVAAVARYPELKRMTLHGALTTAKELDAAPDGVRAQRRATLRAAAAHTGADDQAPGPQTTPAARQRPRHRDPDRPWLRAERGLAVFLQETHNQQVVLTRARHWLPEARRDYLRELEAVHERVTTLIRGFVKIEREPPTPDQPEEPPAAPQTTRAAGAETSPEGTPLWPGDRQQAAVQEDGKAAPSLPAEDGVADDGGLPSTHVRAVATGAPLQAAQDSAPVRSPASGTPAGVPDSTADGTEGEPSVPASDTPAFADQSGEGDAGEAEDGHDRHVALAGRIQALLREGASWRGIASTFNAEGVPTLSGKGRWNDRTLSRFAERKGVRKAATLDGC
jgi:ParB-like chromosome segregation protein Spo0J